MCTPQTSWGESDINHNCNARFVSTGSLTCPPLIVFALQLVIISLFFAFPASIFVNDLPSLFPLTFGIILSCGIVFFYLSVSFTDPGIIPRSDKPLYLLRELRPPRIQRVLTSQGRISLTFCEECHTFRGRGVDHSPQSNNCIMNFDHHCPWVGNDVGRRNYRDFLLFVFTSGVFLLFAMVCCILLLANVLIDFQDAKWIGTLIVLVLCFVTSLFVFPLCFLHIRLVSQQRTTAQVLLKRNRSDENEHATKSCCGAFASLLTREAGPSLVRRKVMFEPVVPKEVSPASFTHMRRQRQQHTAVIQSV